MNFYNDEPLWSNERLLTNCSHSCNEFCVCSLRVNVFWGEWVRIVQIERVFLFWESLERSFLLLLFISYDFEGIWNVLLDFLMIFKCITSICVKVNCNFSCFMDMVSVIKYFCPQQLLCVIALMDDALPVSAV